MERRLMVAIIALVLSLGYSILEKEINNTKNVFIYPAIVSYFTIGEYAVEKISNCLKVRIIYVFIGVVVIAVYAIIKFRKKKIN